MPPAPPEGAAHPWDQLADPAVFALVYPRFLARYTPPEAASGAGEPRAGVLGDDGGEPSTGDVGGSAAGVAELEWRIFKEWTARLEKSLTLIHAAVLGLGGRAVLLAGRTGTGKTTLALALLSRGWTLLSDDCAVLAPAEGAGGVVVWPAPGALHVKGRLSRSLAESERLSPLLAAVPYPSGFFPGGEGTPLCCLARPEALAEPGRPWPVAGVYLLSRREGDRADEGSAPTVEPMSPGAALTELLFHSFARTPALLGRDFRLLARLVRAVACRRLVPGEPAATAACVEGLHGAEDVLAGSQAGSG